MMKRNNRTAGHNFERDIRLLFRELGFSTETARFASKMLDDAGVDFVNTGPFAVQAKYTKVCPNMQVLLNEMPQDGKWNVCFHKRSRAGTTVTMQMDDFLEWLKMSIELGVIGTQDW